jgi:hypothetical protein
MRTRRREGLRSGQDWGKGMRAILGKARANATCHRHPWALERSLGPLVRRLGLLGKERKSGADEWRTRRLERR